MDLNKKCYCKYDEEGNLLGLCLRCFEIEMEGKEKGENRILSSLKEQIEGMKKELHFNQDIITETEGVLNNYVDIGHNKAIDDVLQLIDKMEDNE